MSSHQSPNMNADDLALRFFTETSKLPLDECFTVLGVLNALLIGRVHEETPREKLAERFNQNMDRYSAAMEQYAHVSVLAARKREAK